MDQETLQIYLVVIGCGFGIFILKGIAVFLNKKLGLGLWPWIFIYIIAILLSIIVFWNNAIIFLGIGVFANMYLLIICQYFLHFEPTWLVVSIGNSVEETVVSVGTLVITILYIIRFVYILF